MKFRLVLVISFLTYLHVYTSLQNANLIDHHFSKINIYCQENFVKTEVSKWSQLQCASKCLPLHNQYCKAFVWDEIGKTCKTIERLIMHDLATPVKLDVYIPVKDGCTNKGYYYDMYSNTCLKMFADNTGKTWTNARKHCIYNGGDLISLTTSAKWEFVSNFTSCRTNMWIGLKDEKWVTNEIFKNVFNVTVDFNQYDSDFPADTEQLCGKYAYTSSLVLQDESCNLRLKEMYVCEIFV
ncbi:CD206 [Mytilus edulis]|uniref:MRC n=1 Tax=Mytilus edulis TaxID=6550 RepID=A0A8S3R2D0_MYTED|nr:CD206 [Mytilus edulis]